MIFSFVNAMKMAISILFLVLALNNFGFVFFGISDLAYTKFVAVSFVVVFVFYFTKSRLILYRQDLPVFLYVVGVLLAVYLQLYFKVDVVDVHERSSHEYLVSRTFNAIAYIFVGYCVSLIGFIRHSNIVSVVLLWILSVGVFLNSYPGFKVDYDIISASYDVPVNHLMAGPGVSLVLILSVCCAKGLFRWAAFASALVILFALNGRADFLSFIIAFLFLEILQKTSYKFLNWSFIIAVLSFVLLSLLIGYLAFEFPVSYLSGVDLDESFMERIILFGKGVEMLPAQMLYGDISMIAIETNSLGGYIHNIISAWQFYGFFIFSLSLYWLFVLVNFSLNMPKSSENVLLLFVSFLFIFTVVNLLLAKAITWVVFWISLGLLWGRRNIIYSYLDGGR